MPKHLSGFKESYNSNEFLLRPSSPLKNVEHSTEILEIG